MGASVIAGAAYIFLNKGVLRAFGEKITGKSEENKSVAADLVKEKLSKVEKALFETAKITEESEPYKRAEIAVAQVEEKLCGKCKKVTAHVSNDHLKGIIEVEDNASVLMELESGITAMMYATTAYAENSDVLIEITFENGKLRFEGDRLYSVDKNGNISEACERPEAVYHGQSYWGVGHSILINDYYDCLKTGRKFSIDAFEGGNAARLVFACYESSQKGESVEIL
jgi:hypothetical protein